MVATTAGCDTNNNNDASGSRNNCACIHKDETTYLTLAFSHPHHSLTMPPATHHSFARLTITPRPECTNHKPYESSVEDDGALDFFEFAEIYSSSSDSTSSWGDDAQDEDPTDMPLAVEIVDGKFGDRTAGCYRIVSSDDVVFYIPGKLLRQG